MSKTLNTKILLRNDTIARWESNNPTLSKGEIGIAIDNTSGITLKNFKIGDGITSWNNLDWAIQDFVPSDASADNDGYMSSSDYVKLQGIEAGADVSPSVQVNGTEVTPVNGVISITIPENTSDLTNDSDFITSSDIPTAVSELTNDSEFITINDIPTISVNGSTVYPDNNDINIEAITEVSVNGSALTPNAGSVDVEIPIVSISVNSDEVTPDQDGNVDITIPTDVYDLEDSQGLLVFPVISVNSTLVPVSGGTIDIAVPTATSDLTNDSGFITTSDIPQGAAATTTTPLMDGTAAVGTELAFARGDHRHPSDTNKVNTSAIQTSLNLSSTSDTNIYSQKVINNALNGKVDNSTLNSYYTKTEIDNKISSVFNYKGTKAAVANLPSSGNTTGDVWHVTATDSEYVWDGSQWQELGGVVDLSGYLQSVSIAGTTLTPSSSSITAASLKTALSMGAAAEKAVDSSISSTTSTNLPTSAAVASYVSSHATQVAASATNGHITVDNTDVTVYTLPSTVVQSSDVLILDCGNSTNNYS